MEKCLSAHLRSFFAHLERLRLPSWASGTAGTVSRWSNANPLEADAQVLSQQLPHQKRPKWCSSLSPEHKSGRTTTILEKGETHDVPGRRAEKRSVKELTVA